MKNQNRVDHLLARTTSPESSQTRCDCTGLYFSGKGDVHMDVWSILEHGGGKTMAVSREDVLSKLEVLVRDRGSWYIERLQIADSEGNRYYPEVGADGAVGLVLKSGPSRKRR